MVAVVSIAGVLLWQGRHWIDTDTVTYADMSDALLRGDWRALINGYFSPAWAIMIALARWTISTTAELEAPVIRGLQWLLTFVVVWLAHRFVTELRRWTATLSISPLINVLRPEGTILFWTGVLLAVNRLSVGVSNPDLLLTCLALGASSALLAFHRTPDVRRAVWVGVWLGAMFWTKGIALPIGAGYVVAVALLATPAARLRMVGTVTGVFSLIAFPLVFALSHQQRRIDLGDTGLLTMRWFTVGASSLTPDPRVPASAGQRWNRMLNEPPVYTYVGGALDTYPPWRDPVYWQGELKVRPTLAQVVQRVRSEGAGLWNFYLGALVASLMLAAAAVGGLRAPARRLTCALLMPAIIAVLSYLPILFEPRYFAPVIVTALGAVTTLAPANGRRWPWLMVAAFASAGWSLPTVREALAILPLVLGLLWLMRAEAMARRVAVGVLATTLIAATLPGIVVRLPGVERSDRDATFVFEDNLARSLNDAGVKPGTRIAMIGIVGPGYYELWWARRARLHLIAEVPRGAEPRFWGADASGQQAVFNAMASVGAAAVVARRPPDGRGMDAAWVPLGATGFAVRSVTPAKD